jgi:hypothetical protein
MTTDPAVLDLHTICPCVYVPCCLSCPACSAIPLPPSDYPLFDAYPQAVVQQGRLSQLQLEGVLYACSRHQQILPSGERAGFFIGQCV